MYETKFGSDVTISGAKKNKAAKIALNESNSIYFNGGTTRWSRGEVTLCQNNSILFIVLDILASRQSEINRDTYKNIRKLFIELFTIPHPTS